MTAGEDDKPNFAQALVQMSYEIGGTEKGCFVYQAKDSEFNYVTQQAKVETKWHEQWSSLHGQTLPAPLSPPEVWQHPKLSERYASTMHENSSATDVSVEPGPIPANPRVEYFHVLEKGTRLSGMSPFYTFLDEHTIVTISFGRDAATLLVVDISGEAVVLDHVAIPGRGSKAIPTGRRAVKVLRREGERGARRDWARCGSPSRSRRRPSPPSQSKSRARTRT